jgi:hypothetical protein
LNSAINAPKVEVPIKTIQLSKRGRASQQEDALRKRPRIARMKISYNTVNASQPIVDGHRVDHVHTRPSPQVHYRDG